MSTSNRLARAVDRHASCPSSSRRPAGSSTPEAGRRLRELIVSEQRTLQLLAALRSIYLALGSFAFATLISLIGAVLVPFDAGVLVRTFEAIAVMGGIVAVGALVYGSTLLVRETRLAVQVLHERAENIRALAAAADARKN